MRCWNGDFLEMYSLNVRIKKYDMLNLKYLKKSGAS